MVALHHTNRSVFKLQGPDTFAFLQGVITNDIETLPEKEILYTVMLTSKGRFHFEFFLYKDPQDSQGVYLDTPQVLSGDLLKRLKIFKLRSDVTIEDISEQAIVVTYHDECSPEKGVFEDPRCAALGYRGLVLNADLHPHGLKIDEAFYTALCLENCIPRAGAELIPEKTIPLEANLEEFGALSFSKGCYLGQELTARTKHQGLVRKKLFTVQVDGDISQEMLDEGVVIYAETQKLGVLLSYQNGVGIAKLRIEEAGAQQGIKWQGVLKESKKECCKIQYLPRK